MGELDFLRIGMGLVGLLIFGEACALLVGMHFLSSRSNPWISLKNDLFLGVDIITGLGLLFCAVAAAGTAPGVAAYIFLAAAALTHGYRLWEYAAGAANRFCINLPLFVFNDIKLVGVLIVAGAAAFS